MNNKRKFEGKRARKNRKDKKKERKIFIKLNLAF